jgi:hypothetical protein
MPNSIKHSTTGDTQSLKKGNFFFGVGDVGKGPSSSSGHYNGVTPMSGGYTIYSYNVNETSKISFHTANSDLELISYTNIISGQGFTTAVQCLNWYATQTNYACVNKNYEGIITDGLVFNVDAGFIPSYPTNGTGWYDISHNGNNATLVNGPAFSSLNGGSIVFDGADDVVSTNLVQTFTNELTVDTWYRGTKTTRNHLWNFYGSNLNCNFNDSGYSLWMYWEGNGGNRIWWTSPNFTDGNIHHLVFRHSGSVNQIYLDGQLLTPNQTAGTQTFSGVGGSGYDLASLGPFGGNIYSNRVYSRALSSSEILQNYNAGLARFNTANIVKNNLMLNLDASNAISYPTTGTKWNDLSGYGNVGTLANGPTFNSTTRSIVFDGADDYVSDGSSTYDITNQFTVEVLCNPTQEYNGMFNFVGPNGSDRGMMAHWPWGGDYGYFDITNTSNAFFRWYKAGAGILNVRALYHFILNPNGQVVVKQNNQIMTPSGTDTFTGNVSLGSYNTIGAFSSAQLPWKGEMSKFRVYNRALTDAETTQNYYGSPIITDGLIMALDAGNFVSYPGSGTTWKDLTTNGTNGTLTNGTTFNSSDGGSIVFDGTDDYMVVPTFSNKPTTAITCESWIKPTKLTVSGTIRGGAISSSNSMYLGIIDSTDGGNTFSMHWANQTNNSRVSNWNGSIPNNSWSYLVGTYDGTMARAYLNGVEIWSTPQTGTIPDATYYVGTYGGSVVDGTHNFNGHIPIARIYNRALTPQEISQNYNAAKSRFGL